MSLSELSSLHRHAGSPLGDALRTLPGYADLTAALDRCAAAVKTRMAPAGAPPLAALDTRLVERLSAGGDVPATVDKEAHAAVVAEAQTQAGTAALLRVQQRLTAERDNVARSGVADLVRHLDREVRELVDEARALDLRGATDADEAIERGVVDGWAELGKLRGRYFLLRDAQRNLVSNLFHLSRTVSDVWLEFENYAELHPSWWRRQPTSTGGSGGPVMTYDQGSAAPWPDDPLGRFHWLVVHPEARVWVPTQAELEQALAQAQQDRREQEGAEREPVGAAEVRRQESLMNRYMERVRVGGA